MKWWGYLAAVAAASATSGASQARPEEPAPLPAEIPALKLLRKVESAATPAERLALLDEALAALAQPTPFRGLVLCARGSLLDQMDRFAEARAAFEECRRPRPEDARPVLALGFEAVEQKQPVEAAQLVMRAAAMDPEAVRTVPPASMTALFRLLRYARSDEVLHRLTDTLVASGWARENPGLFSSLAAVVMRDRLQAGSRKEALALLPSVLSPQTGVGLLIDRRFSGIWPEIENWAGADLSVQKQALLDLARAAYEASHGESELIAYANALADTGHREEAIAQLQRARLAPSGRSDAYHRHEVIVKLGHLLAAVGRAPEGLSLMRGALTGPDAQDRSVANVVPNLAVELLLNHDHAGALALLDARTPGEDVVEDPAAIGYFVALRACALQGLGRKGEARKALSRVQASYATNTDAVEIATGCAGSPDAQAALWISTARDPETRTEALTALAAARCRRERGIPPRSLKGEALMQLTGRRDVDAVYDALARPLPDRYGPAAVSYEAAAGR